MVDSKQAQTLLKEGKIAPPTNVIDKAKFNRKIEVTGVKLPVKSISQFQKIFRDF